MKKKLSNAVVALMLILCCVLTGCSKNASDNNNSELPYVGMAEISGTTTVNCVISGKQADSQMNYDGLRNRYFITVQAEDGSSLRFQTNGTFYEQAEIGSEGEVLVCDVEFPLGGSEKRYYINGEELENVWITYTEPVEQASPAVGKYATLVSETIKSFSVTGFEFEKISTGKFFVYHHYVYLQAEDGTAFRFDNEFYFNRCVVGDVIDILVQTINYPIGDITQRYCLYGQVLSPI